jgi:hypothetical protein
MQSHHQEPSLFALPRFTSSILPPSPVDDPLHTAIQDYLDQVCAPLIGVMSYTARMELRTEIEQHLRALIEAHRELGAPPDTAFALAIEKFGKPEQVARQWNP